MNKYMPISIGLGLWAFPALSGLMGLSPYVLPLQTMAFYYAWFATSFAAFQRSGAPARNQGSLHIRAFIGQFIIVAVIYLIFFGVASLLWEKEATPFGAREWLVVAATSLWALIVGWVGKRMPVTPSRMEVGLRMQQVLNTPIPDPQESEYEGYLIGELLDEAGSMEKEEIIMPIEIFSLARKFAQLEDKESTLAVTTDILAASGNAFVRRVYFSMVRFMEGQFTLDPTVIAALLNGLRDESNWVRGDAAWAVETHRISTPEILQALHELANTEFSGDDRAKAFARQHAQKAIDALVNP